MNSLKFLLAALNTKYIHSNPGIYSLYSYSVKRQPSLAEYIGIAEYTINNQKGEILADIYKRRPDAVGFSCYIFPKNTQGRTACTKVVNRCRNACF